MNDPEAMRRRIAELEELLANSRRAEEAQRSDRARLDLLVEQLPAIIYTVDRDLTFTSSLGSGLQKIGLKPDEVVGMPLHAFLGESPDAERVQDAHLRALDGETSDYEHHWAQRWFHVHLRPMRDADGSIEGVVGVAHDVTEPRAAAAALRDETRQQLRLIRAAIEHVNDMVIITEPEIDLPGPRIVYANPAFERVTGYRAEEMVGQTPRILQGPATSRAVLRNVRAALEAGRSFDGETVNYRKDRTPYIVQWHIAPVRNRDGDVINWVSIQRDVTEERRQQELARQREAELAHAARLSTIGEMASGLAHELNQPLAAIANYANGCVERLRQDRLPRTDLESVLQRISQQADRSGEVIRRMRRFIRKREPQREIVRVAALIEDVAALLEGELGRWDATLAIEVTEDLPVLSVDSIQIEQVLLNLVRNGLEAMESVPPGQRHMKVRARAEGQSVVIDIVDQGPDVSQESLEQMFSPFYSTKSGGMGVGLNISETLVEAHGGRITARRAQPQGLAVSVQLPIPHHARSTS